MSLESLTALSERHGLDLMVVGNAGEDLVSVRPEQAVEARTILRRSLPAGQRVLIIEEGSAPDTHLDLPPDTDWPVLIAQTPVHIALDRFAADTPVGALLRHPSIRAYSRTLGDIFELRASPHAYLDASLIRHEGLETHLTLTDVADPRRSVEVSAQIWEAGSRIHFGYCRVAGSVRLREVPHGTDGPNCSR